MVILCWCDNILAYVNYIISALMWLPAKVNMHVWLILQFYWITLIHIILFSLNVITVSKWCYYHPTDEQTETDRASHFEMKARAELPTPGPEWFLFMSWLNRRNKWVWPRAVGTLWASGFKSWWPVSYHCWVDIAGTFFLRTPTTLSVFYVKTPDLGKSEHSSHTAELAFGNQSPRLRYQDLLCDLGWVILGFPHL